MPFLTNLLGTLTLVFLVVLAASKFSNVLPAVEGPAFIGFVASGIAWICLAGWEITGSYLALALYPVILTLVLLGPKLLKKFLSGMENWGIKRRKNWRCTSCGKENDGISAVCYYCQSWRKS